MIQKQIELGEALQSYIVEQTVEYLQNGLTIQEAANRVYDNIQHQVVIALNQLMETH